MSNVESALQEAARRVSNMSAEDRAKLEEPITLRIVSEVKRDLPVALRFREIESEVKRDLPFEYKFDALWQSGTSSFANGGALSFMRKDDAYNIQVSGVRLTAEKLCELHKFLEDNSIPHP